MRADSALLDIASSVADGEAVDWSAVSALATDERERALITRLKIIASIGDVHRSTDDAEAPPADGASTLDVRGRVVGHIRPAVGAVADTGALPAAPISAIRRPATAGAASCCRSASGPASTARSSAPSTNRCAGTWR